MSIVISILRDDFAMIAGDTRISYRYPDGRIEYSDDSQKITCVGPLWIGSVGSADFHRIFSSLLANQGVTLVDDLESKFYLACERVKELNNQIFLDDTQIVYSFAYMENSLLKMHLEYVDLINGRSGIRDNNVLISFLPEDSLAVENVANKYKTLIEDSKNIIEVIYNTACYIEAISEVNSTVGKVCDFGITLKESNNKIVQVNIRESVEAIKKAHHENNLHNYLKVITFIGN